MISGFQVALKNSIDVIAPPPTLIDDFLYHWKRLMSFYSSYQSNCKLTIECTSIPHHLNRLVDILLNEEKDDDYPGLCLEYLLQNKLLDWIVTLASVETPPGMRLACFLFFRKLLAYTKFPLLHQYSVYIPVQRLICLCSGTIPSAIEHEEIKFLLTLCYLVCRFPHLMNIIDDSSKLQHEISVIKNDSEHLDIHSVTYIPTKKKTSNNPLFQPLNTQAIMLMNPSLFCDNQRSTSVSGYELDSRKVNNKSLTHEVLTESNELTSSMGSGNSSICSSPVLHQSHQYNAHSQSVFDDDNLGNYDKKSNIIFPPVENTGNILQNLKDSKRQNSSILPALIKPKSLFLNALISYLNTADNTVRVRTCEGIMALASLNEPNFVRTMVSSNLSEVIAARLENAFNSIPAYVDPADIDDIDVTWGLDSPLWTNEKKFPGCRQVAAYFVWVDYCDQLIKEAQPDVGLILAKNIRILFFDKILTPALGERHVLLITALVTETLRKIAAPILNIEIGYWIAGEQRHPGITAVYSSSVIEQLIKNCFTECDDLTLETLKLFEEILNKRNEHVLHCMILSHLATRGYYDNSAADSAIASWSDEEDEREREKKCTLDFSQKQYDSRTLAPSNIHRIINCFLSLMPRQLQTDLGEDNYERYMNDWKKQYTEIKEDCTAFAWPLEATSIDDTGSYDSRTEVDHSSSKFDMGPFISMLLEKVMNFPHQKYEINLQLTIIISRLALLPHAYLHEFLLNPLIPLIPGSKTLFSSLQKVIKYLNSEVSIMPNYKDRLRETRKKLLKNSSYQVKENILYESVIITEEFCKELAAIAYVKYQNSR